MKKTPKLDTKEMQLFLDAIAGTKRLISKKSKIRLQKPKETIITKPTPGLYQEQFGFLEKEIDNTITSDSVLSYNHASISNKTLRNLRKGQYNVAAILDLHGKTIEKARIALDKFLLRCINDHIQVVLVIHGKGNPSKTPVLKSQLYHWLQQTNLVLAFCTALPKHGGTGAVYVLLQKQKGNPRR